ncbi:MAG TPA: sialidase family protein [Verrucomicrobiae bacterium]|jgi:sialidase-1|nr:sialidase family protein [Verrucomicrobiae bacterium]
MLMQFLVRAISTRSLKLVQKIRTTPVLLFAAIALMQFSAFGDEPQEPLPFTGVFTNGSDGYPVFRIPAIVKTHQGTLLAFAEARAARADGSQNKIVLKRSHDKSVTWEKAQLIWDDSANSLNNPTVVVENQTGRIVLIFQRYPKGIYENDVVPGLDGERICRAFVTYSDDDGLTWAKPTDITASVKRPTATSIASGPGIGIQLARGKHAGRIIIPFNQGPIATGKVYAVFSDDRGATWKYGQTAPGESKGSANEVQMVELSDGSVLLNARNQHGPHVRKTAVSHDGGETWSTLQDEPQLIEPTCQASLIRHSTIDNPIEEILLFSNPASTTARTNGTIRLSRDEGKTWPISRVICPDRFGYSCLVSLDDKNIGCLFEHGQKICFCRFSLDWLMDIKETAK